MAVVGGAGSVWGALVGAGVITIVKQWLEDLLPHLLGQSGNFEVIVFGLVMIIVLHRARDGLWPALVNLFQRCLPIRPESRPPPPAAAPLPTR